MELTTLLQQTGMWRASSIDCLPQKGIPSGFPVLDQYLPGGGWPSDGITELMFDQPGIGEMRLLAPALAHLSQTQTRWILWVSPPYIPYAPALAGAGLDLSRVLLVNPKTTADLLWVLEKALASKSCSAVLAWPGNIREKEIRRLQVASKEGSSFGLLFRNSKSAKVSSPAELRLQLFAASASPFSDSSTINLRILKRRGGWATEIFTITFADKLNLVTPDFSEMVVDNRTLPRDYVFRIDRAAPGAAIHDFNHS